MLPTVSLAAAVFFAPARPEVPSCCAPPAEAPADAPDRPASALTRADARAAFAQFKALEGDWIGKSTKGWEEKVNYRTIARGSCVLHTSFDAHPDETMLTLFHLDGDRLLLTHYCVAGNQPRLQATERSADGAEILFTFLDATNLPSRDKGHMDACRITFIDADTIVTQWTWYQDGTESWMEEIRLERVKIEEPAIESP